MMDYIWHNIHMLDLFLLLLFDTMSLVNIHQGRRHGRWDVLTEALPTVNEATGSAQQTQAKI